MSASHSRTVASSLAVASRCPSGLNATPNTRLVWLWFLRRRGARHRGDASTAPTPTASPNNTCLPMTNCKPARNCNWTSRRRGTVNLRSCGRSANHISLIRHTRPGESRRRTGENRPRIAQVDSAIENKAVTYDGLVDIGFTRNFASSQAYREQFGNRPDTIARRRQGWAGLREVDVEEQTRRKPDTQAFRDRVVFST